MAAAPPPRKRKSIRAWPLPRPCPCNVFAMGALLAPPEVLPLEAMKPHDAAAPAHPRCLAAHQLVREAMPRMQLVLKSIRFAPHGADEEDGYHLVRLQITFGDDRPDEPPRFVYMRVRPQQMAEAELQTLVLFARLSEGVPPLLSHLDIRGARRVHIDFHLDLPAILKRWRALMYERERAIRLALHRFTRGGALPELPDLVIAQLWGDHHGLPCTLCAPVQYKAWTYRPRRKPNVPNERRAPAATEK